MQTTKGTGGDIIVLEEAAYVDPGFFYETVAPLMIVGTTTLIGISTLTSEINFYTRLIRLRDKVSGLPLFTVMQVELACAKCKEDGKAVDCVHLLHLVPRWQSSERHRRLKLVMQDRPDLIESELSGLAFDSLQQCFRPADIDALFEIEALNPPLNDDIYLVIDPAGIFLIYTFNFYLMETKLIFTSIFTKQLEAPVRITGLSASNAIGATSPLLVLKHSLIARSLPSSLRLSKSTLQR